jgi:hypothetical protein
MANVTLRAFSSESAAKTYFTNKVVESQNVDGVMIKIAGEIVYRQDNGGYTDLTQGQPCYLIVSYSRGTGIQVDSGSDAGGDQAVDSDTKKEEEPAGGDTGTGDAEGDTEPPGDGS